VTNFEVEEISYQSFVLQKEDDIVIDV